MDSAEDDKRYRQFAEASQFVTALVLYPIVSLLGMAGSALCILVLSQRQMLTSTNAYLIALAVADLVKLANDFLYFPVTLLQLSGSRRGHLVFAHLYPYAFFLSQYTAGCAAWLTVVVAAERCLIVTHPNWSRYSLTVRKSRIVSGATFAVVLLISAPYLLRYEIVCEAADGSLENATSENCTWLPRPSHLWSQSALGNYSKYYVQGQSCLKSLVPLLVLIVLNVRIVMVVRQTRANKKLASRNRVTVMLAMVILCYIVFTMPDSALSAMGWGYTEVTTNLRRGIREISDLLLAVNSSVNFFLYVSFNRVFRQNLLALCYRGRTGRGGPLPAALMDEQQRYSRAAASRAATEAVAVGGRTGDCSAATATWPAQSTRLPTTSLATAGHAISAHRPPDEENLSDGDRELQSEHCQHWQRHGSRRYRPSSLRRQLSQRGSCRTALNHLPTHPTQTDDPEDDISDCQRPFLTVTLVHAAGCEDVESCNHVTTAVAEANSCHEQDMPFICREN